MKPLAFLDEIQINPDEKAPMAPWLLVDSFYDNSWKIRGPANEIYTFNWNKMMPTGTPLTSTGIEGNGVSSRILCHGDMSELPHYVKDNDYRKILNLVKRIVFYVKHRRITRRCSSFFHIQFFNELITFTEWIFLNKDKFKPIDYLFELVDTNDLQDEYIALWVLGGKSELLNIEERMQNKLKEILCVVKNDNRLLSELNGCMSRNSGIRNIDPSILPYLMFEVDETKLLRAWLKKNKYYYDTKNEKGILKVESLFKDLIHQNIKSDTLPPLLQAKLRTLFAVENARILDFSPKSVKEFFPSGELRLFEKVRSLRGFSSKRILSINIFMTLLQKVSRYINGGLPNPSVFRNICFDNIDIEHLRPSGSTKTIPPEVAIHCLGEAVGFVINFGDELVEFASKVKSEISTSRNNPDFKTPPYLSYLSQHHKLHIPSFSQMPSSIKPLNICQLGSIYEDGGLPKFNIQGGNARAEIVRNTMGLEDALNLLIASTIIIIGTTAARRQIEIKTLETTCLEKVLGVGWYIRFELGKDNFGSSKGMPARCIPNIAAKAIKLICKLNQHWQMEHSLLSDKLFFGYSGSLTESKHLSRGIYNRFLDCFCDFVEIPLDSDGKRWYIRTHEMRRFWAYSFFYKMGLGELDTIGWYLGHTEAEHTWAYIRESFDGHDKEMQRIKAAYAADILTGNYSGSRENDSAIEYIKNLVFTHFNRSQIELVEKEELIDCISELLRNNELDIEPKFIKDTKGIVYELIWLLKRRDRS